MSLDHLQRGVLLQTFLLYLRLKILYLFLLLFECIAGIEELPTHILLKLLILERALPFIAVILIHFLQL